MRDTAHEKLKQQRDRFIAFAFAGADLLLEMTEDDVVAYAAGAGEALYGLSDTELLGKALEEFIFPRDRKRYADALIRLRNTGRLDHTPLTLMGAAGTVTRMRMAGIRLPQFHTGTYHLVLSRIPPGAAEADARADTDPKVRFADTVRQRLNEANRVGEDFTLTLLDLSGAGFRRIEPAALQTFLATLNQALEEISVRQASAGPIGDRSFGLVHNQSVSAEVVRQKVDEVTRRFSGKTKGVDLSMRSASLEMDDSSLSDDDIAKALTYIMTTFIKDSAGFAIKSLAEGARIAVEDTLTRVRNFRRMVKSDKLAFLFQPIVNLRSGAILKYEAFGRISHNGAFFLPSQIIPFATDVGVIGEFDLMALKKGLAMMREAVEISPLAHLSVNISGVSLGNPTFCRSLIRVLEEQKDLLGRLCLEITDALRIENVDDARRLLLRLKRIGVRLSLDDFGSGGAAFDCLRALPVDYAKIEANYIVDAREARGKSVLRAIANLCRDLGVVTIGKCVEDAQMLKILGDVGIEYAQGHFFAQPTPDAARKIRYYKDHIAPQRDLSGLAPLPKGKIELES